MNYRIVLLFLAAVVFVPCQFVQAQLPDESDLEKHSRLQLLDLFQMEYAADPQISPDGKTIVYVRTRNDIMKDRRRTSLWTIDSCLLYTSPSPRD